MKPCLHCAGVELDSLQVSEEVLAGFTLPVIEVASLLVHHLSLGFPSWSRPLRLRLVGLHLELRQRQQPQARFQTTASEAID